MGAENGDCSRISLPLMMGWTGRDGEVTQWDGTGDSGQFT